MQWLDLFLLETAEVLVYGILPPIGRGKASLYLNAPQRLQVGRDQADGRWDRPDGKGMGLTLRGSAVARSAVRLVGSGDGAWDLGWAYLLTPRFLWECLTSPTLSWSPSPATSNRT